MKNIILLIILFLGIWSCTPDTKTIGKNGGLVIKVKASDMSGQNETPDSIVNILTKRFKGQYPDNNVQVRFEEAYGLYSIEIPAADTAEYSSALVLATATGNFKVSELHRLEINLYGNTDPIFTENDTLKLLTIYDSFNWGVAEISDTSKINAFFRTPKGKELLPKNYNTKFVWGEKLYPDEEKFGEKMTLYCLKESPFNIPLSIACKELKLEKNYSGYYIIAITLKREYAQRFENLTRNNIGYHITIVCDDIVLSSLMVNDAITGGKLAIPGSFEYDTFLLINSLLAGGQLSSPLHVIDIEKY